MKMHETRENSTHRLPEPKYATIGDDAAEYREFVRRNRITDREIEENERRQREERRR